MASQVGRHSSSNSISSSITRTSTGSPNSPLPGDFPHVDRFVLDTEIPDPNHRSHSADINRQISVNWGLNILNHQRTISARSSKNSHSSNSSPTEKKISYKAFPALNNGPITPRKNLMVNKSVLSATVQPVNTTSVPTNNLPIANNSSSWWNEAVQNKQKVLSEKYPQLVASPLSQKVKTEVQNTDWLQAVQAVKNALYGKYPRLALLELPPEERIDQEPVTFIAGHTQRV